MPLVSTITYPFRRAMSYLTRNYAFANSFLTQVDRPIYTNWTIQKAVKHGYKINGWVYRAVTLAMKSASSVPWGVVDENEEQIEDDPLSLLLNYPNKFISRQDLFELWISHLELTGNALSLKVKAEGRTAELWPVSPDRIHPVVSKKIDEWIKGYALDQGSGVKWLPEEILHFKYFDPADPYWGMSPLQVVAKTVDIDTDQRDWNKSAMQNQGVMSGVFSFKKELDSQDDADAIAERLNARYAGPKNARKIAVLGGEAKYHRIAATPQELDFGGSREANMNEIFIVFGTPPQYAGSQKQSTYNNYQTSELIYWFQKIIPLLDDLRDTFNFSFRDELLPGRKITYFLQNIPAIRRAMLEKAKTAKMLYTMGVPFDRLNKIFTFGIEEFDGWETSYPGGTGEGQTEEVSDADKKKKDKDDKKKDIDDSDDDDDLKDDGLKDDDIKAAKNSRNEIFTSPEFQNQDNSVLAVRDLTVEAEEREEYSIEHAVDIDILLIEQQRIIFEALEQAADEFGRIEVINPEILLRETWAAEWEPVYNNITIGIGVISANQIVVEKREEDQLRLALEEYFKNEKLVLNELGHIEKSIIDEILLQVRDALDQGKTVSQLQQAIIDTGVLGSGTREAVSTRALRLSRTITGTASSMGQFFQAGMVEATHKKWIDSGFEVRDEHQERANEPAVGLNARFSAKFGALIGPRFPLDPDIKVADRVNCRCSMIFEIREPRRSRSLRIDKLDKMPSDIVNNLKRNFSEALLTRRKKDTVDWAALYQKGNAHWADDMQPSIFAQEFTNTVLDKDLKSVLEIGCGGGRDSILFALAGLDVTAIDLIPEAIAIARVNAENADVVIKFQVDNSEKLSFPDQSFDSIFTLSVLHSTDIGKSLQEIRRVLKPGGFAFIHVYSNTVKINGSINPFINLDEYISQLKRNKFRLLDIYTHMEEEYDEAGEKHLVIVSRVEKK